jgi:two-component system nitrate/nitrite response regulator NarL
VRANHLGRLTPIQVLVVQEHPMLARELVEILEREPGVSVHAIARTGADAVLAATGRQIGVVLIDYRLPDMTGAAAAGLIKRARPETAIVFHTADVSEDAMLDAIDAGACAYLAASATADEVVEAVRRADQGEVLMPAAPFVRAIARRRKVATDELEREKLVRQFTARELDVLRLLALGYDTMAMAKSLGIAPHTVEWHIRHAVEKLRVHSKLQALITAVRLGVVDLQPAE